MLIYKAKKDMNILKLKIGVSMWIKKKLKYLQ